jgi:hypothetical protein
VWRNLLVALCSHTCTTATTRLSSQPTQSDEMKAELESKMAKASTKHEVIMKSRVEA